MQLVKGMPLIVGLARRIMRWAPRLRRILGRSAGKMVRSGVFTVPDARASLDTSLRELGRERIDLYLLHECEPSVCDSHELLEFLEQEVRKGRIGAYGVGAKLEAVCAIAESRPAFARVIQYAASRPGPLPMPATPTRLVITHGNLGGPLSVMQTRFRENPMLARKWSEALALDCSNADVFSGILLAAAVHANPTGIVLFSSTRAEAVRANVAAVANWRYTTEQIERLYDLFRTA